MTRELTAATEHAGVRLDAFLSADGALTRSQAARLIAEGRVRVNGKPAAKSARLSGGETVTVDVPQLRETALPPQDIPLDVVYEDDDVIVVNKPTGLVVHPAPGHPDGTWSTPCSTTAATVSPASAAKSAPASSTASTAIPAASSSPPKTTPPTWPSARS